MKITLVAGTRPNFIKSEPKPYQILELWDGHAADRIIEIMLKW